jgi:prepilin-type N-terminal cleavage/methylation domain-containing protein
MKPSVPGRPAFTLIELMVVVAIMATLMALLLPAVQSAREAARRGSCQGKLKQLATAVMGYEAAHGSLPAAAVVSEGPVAPTCVGCWDPWAEAQLESPNPGTKHGTSWMLEILPYIEATPLFDAWDRQRNVLGNATVAKTDIADFYCPSRRAGIRASAGDHLNLVDPDWRGGGTDYGGCYGRLDGFLNPTASNHRFANRGTLGDPRFFDGPFQPNAALKLASVRDGQSNTILLGELQRLQPNGLSGADNTYNRTSYDGWAVGGVATLFTTATDVLHSNPGGMNNEFFESPGSEHVGGAFFAMADGSVHFLSEFIDAKDNNSTFPLLGSMRDGEIASLAAANN